MRVFNVRTKDDLFKICCDTRVASKVAAILEASTLVSRFNIADTEAPHPEYKKYAKGLSMQSHDVMTDTEMAKAIIDAIDRINNACMEKHAGCQFESFVGSPGDFSPPHCRCERCIDAGRAFKYESYSIELSQTAFEYFKTVLSEEKQTKKYRWGLEYSIPNKCCIALYNQGEMSIHSNKPTIRIGRHVFHHETKTWTTERVPA